jgi:hypothetical protein
MFRLPLLRNQTPKSAFLHINECQELAILADNPYAECPVLAEAMAQLAMAEAMMINHMAALQLPPVQQIMIPQQQLCSGLGGRGSYCDHNYGGNGQDYGIPNVGYAPPPTGGFTTGMNQSSGFGHGGHCRNRRNYCSVAAANQQQLGIPQPAGTQLYGSANQNVPFGGITQTTHTTTPNPMKKFANWNYCFSCGFDVADDHMSMTCPMLWRKVGHQEGCTRNNVQQYVAAGYTPSMVGKHTTQFPQYLDPMQLINVVSDVNDDDDVTVVTSNIKYHLQQMCIQLLSTHNSND